jgi:hypothetical protein
MNGFKKLIFEIITIAGWIYSLILTIRFTIALYSPQVLTESIMACGAGFLWNTIEIGLLIYYKDNKQSMSFAYFAFVGCLIFALVSAAASFGALQIGSEKAVLQSTQYQENLKSIALQDSLVKDLRHAAKRQDKVNYISASKRTLVDLIHVQKDREKYLKKLDTLTESKAGVNNSFFQNLSKLLNIDINLITILCHGILALGLEGGMLFFCGISIGQKNNDTTGNSNGHSKRNFWKRLLNKQSIQDPAITGNNGNEILNENTENEIIANKPVTTSDKKTFGFQPTRNVSKNVSNSTKIVSENNSKIVSGTKSLSNETFQNKDLKRNETLTLTKKNVSEDNLSNKLKRKFNETFQGKTDPFILHIWDNWNNFSSKKRSYGNVSKLVGTILPGTKKSVSKTHVWRTIKRERGGA